MELQEVLETSGDVAAWFLGEVSASLGSHRIQWWPRVHVVASPVIGLPLAFRSRTPHAQACSFLSLSRLRLKRSQTGERPSGSWVDWHRPASGDRAPPRLS